jgi:probable rRNA maturation factor
MIVIEAAIAEKFGRAALPKGRLTRFLASAKTAAGLAGTVSVLLTGDEEIRRLNREYRHKDKATDVLSFPAAEMVGRPRLAGDLAISVETAAREASLRDHALAVELETLLLHGVLHLAGYDHEADSGEMARTEEGLRRKLGLPQGLIARTAGAKAPPRQRRSSARLKSCPDTRLGILAAKGTPAEMRVARKPTRTTAVARKTAAKRVVAKTAVQATVVGKAAVAAKTAVRKRVAAKTAVRAAAVAAKTAVRATAVRKAAVAAKTAARKRVAAKTAARATAVGKAAVAAKTAARKRVVAKTAARATVVRATVVRATAIGKAAATRSGKP